MEKVGFNNLSNSLILNLKSNLAPLLTLFVFIFNTYTYFIYLLDMQSHIAGRSWMFKLESDRFVSQY